MITAMYAYTHICIKIYVFHVLFFAPTFHWSDLSRQQITQTNNAVGCHGAAIDTKYKYNR